jgi:voltage-gated potassium channel
MARRSRSSQSAASARAGERSARSNAKAAEPDSTAAEYGIPASGWRRRMYHVIFESDTPAGRAFDIVLLAIILASVAIVMLDSVQSIGQRFDAEFTAIEWTITLIFTAEYVGRLIAVDRPLRYATSFFGLVDLASVLPTYLAYFFPELHALIDIRLLRLLRAFRILKLTEYVSEYRALGEALHASRRKILVFIATVLTLVVLLGTVMYLVEGAQNGFTNIPVSVYWAISTMTTVGFGDIAPKTDLGRAIASLMMLLGWGVLAVPTGIVTAEITRGHIRNIGIGGDGREGIGSDRRCPACDSVGHRTSARYCQDCGAELPIEAD